MPGERPPGRTSLPAFTLCEGEHRTGWISEGGDVKRTGICIAAVIVTLLVGVFALGVPARVAHTPSAFAEEATGSVTPTPTPAPTPPPVPVDNRPKAPRFIPKKGKAVYIDRAHQRVYLYVDGRQIDKFKCSTSSTLPRRGTYHMKFKRPGSSSFNGAVTFKYQVVFTVGPHGHNIAFHSIPVNHAGHEIAPVGRPVSHGCVRLPYKKAKFLYYWVNKKTPIVVRP